LLALADVVLAMLATCRPVLSPQAVARALAHSSAAGHAIPAARRLAADLRFIDGGNGNA
jgi:hypothetical protein